MEGTAVTSIKCSFPARESATIWANCFSRNTPVSQIEIMSPLDQALRSALATALQSNSTLQELSINGTCLSPVSLALGKNTGLRSQKVLCESMDESLCTSIKNGLETIETLESVEFDSAHVTDDNVAMWCRAVSSLHTDKALKSLVVEVSLFAPKSCLPAFCIDTVAMLQENASLESLFIQRWNRIERIKAEAYRASYYTPNATGNAVSNVYIVPLILLWGPASGLSDCVRPVPTSIRSEFVPDEHKYVLKTLNG
jgi:DNA-directed RNA polymerase subunit L